MFAIILYIGGKFFIIGVALAIWATITQAVIPAGKSMAFLFSNPKLQRNRARALGMSALVAGVVGALLFALPAPLWTRAEGVTWPSERSQVRFGADGFIAQLLAAGGSEVWAGQPLIEAKDPFLKARVEVLESQLRGLRMQLTAAQTVDRVQAAVIREEIATAKAGLVRARQRNDALVVRSPRDGIFVVPNEQDLPGRFVRKGQLIAYVVDPSDDVSARVLVPQDEIGLVRARTRGVEIMAADWGASAYPTTILREVPGGTDRLPSPALGAMGGGAHAVDPRDAEGQTTLEHVFEFEIGVPAAARTGYLGQRVFVKFQLGTEPLGFQAYRALRQLFMRLFSV